MGDGRIFTAAMSQNLHLPTELLLHGAAHGRGGSGHQPMPMRAGLGQNARTAAGRVCLLRGRFRIPEARAPAPASFPKATAAQGGMTLARWTAWVSPLTWSSMRATATSSRAMSLATAVVLLRATSFNGFSGRARTWGALAFASLLGTRPRKALRESARSGNSLEKYRAVT